jgi:hypothetical protein
MIRKIKFIMILIITITSNGWSTIINIPSDYSTIQHGINVTYDGDTVLVQPGTYIENITFNGYNIVLGSLFLMTGDTSFISLTIIDGDSAGSVVRFENDEDSTAVICGFTIRNGFAQYGGGIYCYDSNPRILSNIITENVASDSIGANGKGGGIYCWYLSEPLIENNIISGNIAGSVSAGRGGGISCYGGSIPVIRNNRIIGNASNGDASSGGSSNGGGIECLSCEPVITGNVISGNAANEHGGGICFWNSGGIVTANLITGNMVDYDGGGISIIGSDPTINENVISNNEAGDNGGGISCLNSKGMILDNIIAENHSVTLGGGILCWQSSSPTIQGNLIIKNETGRYGGGVSISIESHPLLNHNTFHQNSASTNGGGIYCSSSPNTIITNTILWADYAPNNEEIYISGGAPTLTYCDIEGGWPGVGNIDCCPAFCSTPVEDYHLTPFSCCLGAGSGGVDIGAFALGCDSLTPNCSYIIGDVNGSNNYNGLDITYGVSYLKGGAPPVYQCECTSCNVWYASGDVNGSCSYNGLDITYGVSYLKGIQPELIPCPDCPPAI